MPEPSTSKRRSTRWIARSLPVLMLALVAYATYDIIVYCCGKWFRAVLLLVKHLF
jgi:palmitoyltransferase